MRILQVLCFTCLSMGLMAQSKYDLEVGSPDNPGHARITQAYPSELILFTMDNKQVDIKHDGVMLFQIWSVGAGSQPEMWTRVREIAARFKDLGLTTISVNFENGASGKIQKNRVAEFFKTTPEPENFYLDKLGYTVDEFRMPGFPHYYLVDKSGLVIFRTNGLDKKGVSVLEEEIEHALK